jgi:hypothetical protein
VHRTLPYGQQRWCVSFVVLSIDFGSCRRLRQPFNSTTLIWLQAGDVSRTVLLWCQCTGPGEGVHS